jgi:hypothetical protein
VATLRHEPNNKARNHLIFCNNAIKAKTQINRNIFTKSFAKQTPQKKKENKVSAHIQDKEEIDCANIIKSMEGLTLNEKCSADN